MEYRDSDHGRVTFQQTNANEVCELMVFPSGRPVTSAAKAP